MQDIFFIIIIIILVCWTHWLPAPDTLFKNNESYVLIITDLVGLRFALQQMQYGKVWMQFVVVAFKTQTLCAVRAQQAAKSHSTTSFLTYYMLLPFSYAALYMWARRIIIIVIVIMMWLTTSADGVVYFA